MSQFAFLQREWAAVYDSAARAETAVHADPRTACFYARRLLSHAAPVQPAPSGPVESAWTAPLAGAAVVT